MTKYIKGKDGKFKGSIGSGKTTVPTATPQAPTYVTATAPEPQTPTFYDNPDSFPYQKDFTSFVDSHLTAWETLADLGISPEHASRISRLDRSERDTIVSPQHSHLFSQPLYSPRDIDELVDNNLESRNTAMQTTALIGLTRQGQYYTEVAELTRYGCDDCTRQSLNREPQDACDQHEHLYDDQTSENASIRETARTAVVEDFVPRDASQDTGDSYAVMSALSGGGLLTQLNEQ